MILVTGATGLVGRTLVQRLTSEGHPVRALTSTAVSQRDSKHPLFPESVQILSGSLHNEQTLHQAMTGVHTVFHLAGAQWWGRRRDLDYVDLKGTGNIIAAARSARIGRLVVMSHLGAAPSSAFLLLRAKGQVEDQVRASGLAYTIFRSGVVFGPEDVFVNGLAMVLRANPAIFLQPGQGEGLLHPIYIKDLIEALVRSMETLNTVDQTLEIGGPEYMSFNEMVRTVMRVTQTPRSIVPVPPYMLRAYTSLLQRLFPAWPITSQWFDILASNRTAPMGNLYDLFGIRPVRFEDTITTYMRGRHYTRELMRNLLRRRHRIA
ncbi:MAG: NAD(P)H-binding protein [Anaerolineae bacterium]|nr:NAD(P)H-binding protein [Anaerolineae bacterium]